ncbi:hypothetical protein AA0118_g11524 [Alternaria tenuissima]|uniref:Peroxidase n=1 Tax=Alternaria tenuissima TaxID=119927 RepID=A0AB37WWB3_9PLEO|nr:hypothetical protein AA0115_g2749 [Alternaria tenuissima]RYN49217.1 hypothetical protein AA0118_g11524 [Alternaria tenuissima]
MLPLNILSLLYALPLTHAALYHPTPALSFIEHVLVDNWGAYASNFSSAITPCTRYVSQTGTMALTSGRTTSAQWMRVMFHDFVTANVSAGTGGIDASIGFETARVENKGSAFNDSFAFWRPFVHDGVSMADLIALATVMSNNLCGGAQMPYRAGRTDATEAGRTTGVPAPETDLEETLLFFERAGFDKVDAIGLTACGHTLGSVHHGGFPEVVDESFVTPENTNGGSNFDTTRGVFDPNVLGEYLNGTGNKGGPLVTSYNDTMNSDLRLYESDKNATMHALFAQGTGFLDTCVELMSRAINTVPAGVQLGEPVMAILVKPINVTYDFKEDGKLMLSGKIRILTPAGASPPSSLNIRINQHETEIEPEAETGSSVFGRSNSIYGTTSYFPFSLSGPTIRDATSFLVYGPGISESTFPITSQAFFVPSLTALEGSSINVTIAITESKSCSDLAVRLAAPFVQHDTLAPKMHETSIAVGKATTVLDDYTLCHGLTVLQDVPTGLVGAEALIGGEVLDTLMVNGGMAGW